MANKPALNAVRKAFDKKFQSSADLFLAVQVFAEGTWDAINGWEALYPGQARRVVALSFLQVVISWEDFIESCFVRYLMGAKSPSGYAPQPRFIHFPRLPTGVWRPEIQSREQLHHLDLLA